MSLVSFFEKYNSEYKIDEAKVLKSIIDMLPDLVYILDVKNDTILYINDKVKTVLGFEQNEVIGNPDFLIENLSNDDEISTYFEFKKLCFNEPVEKTYITFINLKDKNKNIHNFKITNQILKKDENGFEIIKLGIAEEITENISEFGKEILETNTKLTSKFQELNRSNKELEQFAYTASHDLQEPLRKIISFGERLEMKYKDQLQEDGKMYLDRMKDAAKRMKILIDDLLEYSRISNYQKGTENIDLNGIIDEILSDLELKIQDKNAQIKVNKLPHINASKHLLKQLFLNLISNAIKFSKTDEILQISIEYDTPIDSEKIQNYLSPLNKYHKITVKDNGIGFDSEYSEKIFVIFQRLHGRAAYEGTGIGLAICKKIAQQLHGTIKAESNQNEGAVFSVYLPYEENF